MFIRIKRGMTRFRLCRKTHNTHTHTPLYNINVDIFYIYIYNVIIYIYSNIRDGFKGLEMRQPSGFILSLSIHTRTHRTHSETRILYLKKSNSSTGKQPKESEKRIYIGRQLKVSLFLCQQYRESYIRKRPRLSSISKVAL